MPSLFDPIRIGAVTAPNRILMAPMTRARGTRDHLPTAIMIEYYVQRASAGLIISEAIGVSQQGLGWPYATGIWREDQVAGWRRITDAVHDAGGRIVAQLWHMGRIVHPSFMGGASPVSASATTAPGHSHTYEGKAPYAEARALTAEEIAEIVADYRRAAVAAMAAGFDGVQIHAANGYLIDQFLRDGTNLRRDAYGGPIENRIRFLREIAEAVTGAVGVDRPGVRLSPNSDSKGVRDSQTIPLFLKVAEMLSALGIAHLELRDAPLDGSYGVGEMPPLAAVLRGAFAGVLVLNSDFDGRRAQAELDAGVADAVSFGRPFIANPDLPERLAGNQPLASAPMATWFSQGPDGYVDYPSAR